MNHYINTHPEMGRMLWLEQGDIQIGIALDYGIRVRHLSIKGMENLYYQQPADLSDGFGTPDTWKLRGGHRMWLAPESDGSYYPDDVPVSYTIKEDGVLIVQDPEPLLGILVMPIAQQLDEDVWGLLIDDVTEGLAAHRAGVQKGDYIVAADGVATLSSQNLLRVRRQHHVGDEMTLTLWRDGEIFDVTLQLLESTEE